MAYMVFNALNHGPRRGSLLIIADGGSRLQPGADMRLESLTHVERAYVKKGWLLVKDVDDPTDWDEIRRRGSVIPAPAAPPVQPEPPPEPLPPEIPAPEEVAPPVEDPPGQEPMAEDDVPIEEPVTDDDIA